MVVNGESRDEMDGIDGWGYGCGEDGRNLPKGLLISLYLSRRMGGSSLIRSCEAPMVREVLVRDLSRMMKCRGDGIFDLAKFAVEKEMWSSYLAIIL